MFSRAFATETSIGTERGPDLCIPNSKNKHAIVVVNHGNTFDTFRAGT